MLPESKNLQIVADNIRSLENQITALDVEIPPHTAADAGKYLGVDSSGDLEFSKPLPETTGASTGDVLGLTGEGKVPGWITPYTPFDYSSTEEVNTGQKWIDGRDIYNKVITGTLPEMSTASTVTIISGDSSIDEIIDNFSILTYSDNSNTGINRFSLSFTRSNNLVRLASVTQSYSEGTFAVSLYYLHPAPSPEPENLTKKKGAKK